MIEDFLKIFRLQNEGEPCGLVIGLPVALDDVQSRTWTARRSFWIIGDIDQ
jgi:hypothetical protein